MNVPCFDGDKIVVIAGVGNKEIDYDESDIRQLKLLMIGMCPYSCEIQPNMPVLLSSGYAINGHADKIMRRGCNGFIQKPYYISELSQKIKIILDASKGSTQG